MRRLIITVGVAVFILMVSRGVLADESGFLDFEDPDAPRHGSIDAPNPYHGTTWSTREGRSDLGVMDVHEYYNRHWGEFGADLQTLSGDQVGRNRGGFDNVACMFQGDMFIDFYLTPWVGQGAYDVQVDFYSDDVLVHSIMDIPMLDNEWTHVDGRGVAADKIVIRNFGFHEWWLIEDMTFTKVPAPAARIAVMLGLATIGGRRRRRVNVRE